MIPLQKLLLGKNRWNPRVKNSNRRLPFQGTHVHRRTIVSNFDYNACVSDALPASLTTSEANAYALNKLFGKKNLVQSFQLKVPLDKEKLLASVKKIQQRYPKALSLFKTGYFEESLETIPVEFVELKDKELSQYHSIELNAPLTFLSDGVGAFHFATEIIKEYTKTPETLDEEAPIKKVYNTDLMKGFPFRFKGPWSFLSSIKQLGFIVQDMRLNAPISDLYGLNHPKNLPSRVSQMKHKAFSVEETNHFFELCGKYDVSPAAALSAALTYAMVISEVSVDHLTGFIGLEMLHDLRKAAFPPVPSIPLNHFSTHSYHSVLFLNHEEEKLLNVWEIAKDIFTKEVAHGVQDTALKLLQPQKNLLHSKTQGEINSSVCLFDHGDLTEHISPEILESMILTETQNFTNLMANTYHYHDRIHVTLSYPKEIYSEEFINSIAEVLYPILADTITYDQRVELRNLFNKLESIKHIRKIKRGENENMKNDEKENIKNDEKRSEER